MKKENLIFVSDPNELIGQITTEVLSVLQSELSVFKKPERQNSVVYLTRSEVASQLHISFSTIHRMVNNGSLRCFKFGKRSLFKFSDVQAALIQLNTKGGNYAY